MIATAAFFAPLTVTSPNKGFPPLIMIFSKSVHFLKLSIFGSVFSQYKSHGNAVYDSKQVHFRALRLIMLIHKIIQRTDKVNRNNDL